MVLRWAEIACRRRARLFDVMENRLLGLSPRGARMSRRVEAPARAGRRRRAPPRALRDASPSAPPLGRSRWESAWSRGNAQSEKVTGFGAQVLDKACATPNVTTAGTGLPEQWPGADAARGEQADARSEGVSGSIRSRGFRPAVEGAGRRVGLWRDGMMCHDFETYKIIQVRQGPATNPKIHFPVLREGCDHVRVAARRPDRNATAGARRRTGHMSASTGSRRCAWT